MMLAGVLVIAFFASNVAGADRPAPGLALRPSTLPHERGLARADLSLGWIDQRPDPPARRDAPPPVPYGVEYFVATTGSDSNPGTVSAPFATLERAQTAVRAVRVAGLPTNGVAVTIRGGTYRRTSTLTLTSADSGTANSPVVWRAYPGEMVRLTGGRTVTGWTTVTNTDPNWFRVKTSATLYKATIGVTGSALLANFLPLTSWAVTPAGDPAMGGIGISGSGVPFQGDQGVGNWLPHPKIAELIYDGQMMKLARWPKRSDDPAVSTSWVKATPGGSTNFTSATDVTSRGWATISGLSSLNKPWAHIVGGGWHDDVVQMSAISGTAITIASAPRYGIDGTSNQGRWAAVNLLEELTDPGEYWIDRTAGVVYFRAPGGANPASHETVVSELTVPLVWADTTAQYITFDGLTFEATQSFLMRLAGTHITVRNSTFRNAGGSGVLVGNAYTILSKSKFYDLVGSGVVLVGIDVQYMPSTGSSNATMERNEFYRVGRYAFDHVPAIMMGGGTGHHIWHNYIHDIPGIGIYMNSLGAVIDYNLFQRTGLHGFDHGAVYGGGNIGANTTIRYNIFRDIRMNTTYGNEAYIVAGIYCDDYSTGYTTYSNIFYNFIRSATCATCSVTPALVNKTTGNSFRNSIFSNVWQLYYGSAAGANGGSYISNNQTWNVNYGFPSGAESSSTGNPNFADPANGNFSNLPDGTTVLLNGTEPIPALHMAVGSRVAP
jgi:hypothetical protein